MQRSVRLRLLLRSFAIGIAVLGLLDPSCASRQPSSATVAVVVDDPGRDSALAQRVVERLADRHLVIPHPFPDADATILVGTTPPGPGVVGTGALLVVRPSLALTQVGLLRVPVRAAPGAQVSVDGTLQVAGAVGDTLIVLLREQGQLRDRIAIPVASADTTIEARVVALPLGSSSARLEWEAHLASNPTQGLRRATVVTLDAQRTPLLLWAPQPSWLPRFVQQALEGDPQIDLAVSTGTSNGIRTAWGTPPRALDAPGALSPYPLILVTSPALLTDREVGALERHARTTGADIVFLPEEVAGGPWERLVGRPRWQRDSSRVASVRFVDVPDHALVGTLLTWPSPLPFGAVALASSDSAAAPVAWQLPLGPGAAVTIGVLDAWRYRARDRSGFQGFWPHFVRGRLAAAVPPFHLAMPTSVVAPGETLRLDVTVRSAPLETAREVTVPEAHWLGADGAPQRLPLIPIGSGAYQARWLGQAPGEGRVVVTVGGASDSLFFSVTPNAPPRYDPAAPLLEAWIAALDGALLQGEHLDDLPSLLAARLAPGPGSSRWYPMHSAWWLLPFAAALSAEWWLRRRRGAP